MPSGDSSDGLTTLERASERFDHPWFPWVVLGGGTALWIAVVFAFDSIFDPIVKVGQFEMSPGLLPGTTAAVVGIVVGGYNAVEEGGPTRVARGWKIVWQAIVGALTGLAWGGIVMLSGFFTLIVGGVAFALVS